MTALSLTMPDALRRSPGRPAAPLRAAYDRPLTDGDVAALVSRPTSQSPAFALKRLAAIHHSIAKLVAQGLDNITVSRIVGRHPGYISMLKRDPSFRELVAHYTETVTEAFADMQVQLSSLGQEAIAILAEKMETDPEGLSVQDLKDIIKMTMDRTGNGPTKTVRTVDAGEVLRELRAQHDAERQGRVLPREAVTG